MAYYSSEEQAAMDRDTRNMVAAGVPLSGELEALRTLATTGNLGISAAAADVDAVAKGGGAGSYRADVTTGLTFGYGAIRLHLGKALLEVAAGTILLSASATNHVELDRGTGLVSANTTGFTSGRWPLWLVVTGASTISTITGKQPRGTFLGPNGVDGSMLSTPAATKDVSVTVGTIATSAGSTKFCVVVPTTIAAASKITKARLVSAAALTASDTNYVTFGIVNKGAAGAGTQTLADVTAAANSTKVTGGSAIAAYTPRDLTLVAISGGAERDVTGGDVLELTFTVTGTLANTLTQVAVLLEFSFLN